MGFLVALLIICVVFWAARRLLAAFKVEDPIATVVYVALVLLVLGWLFGGITGGPTLTLPRLR